MKYPVAALYIDPAGPYPDLVVEAFDAQRDARNYAGFAPVVAHPPCRSWASLRAMAKPEPGEKDLALHAVACVRAFGGVLEHPARSMLWQEAGLPMKGRDQYGGFTVVVDQFWFGHRAQKRTALYVCGIEPNELPVIPLVLGDAPRVMTNHRLAGGVRPKPGHPRFRSEVTRSERHLSPTAFAHWLCQIAQRAGA